MKEAVFPEPSSHYLTFPLNGPPSRVPQRDPYGDTRQQNLLQPIP